MEVCISRIEGIQRLLGETSVAKNCPATPVVHGTLHLGIGGRQPVRILCRRSVRGMPLVRSASGPGFGAWLVDARLATSPDIVRRALFFLKRAWALVCL